MLPFGELEPSAGASLSVFFTFHHSGVPGQKAVTAQTRIIALIYLAERPGQPVTASPGLAVGSAAINIDQYVEFVFTGGDHQGLTHHHGMFSLGKILGQFPAVNNDFTGSIPNIHPGDRGFSSSGTNTKVLNHISPLEL
jgi:hypothetical protein